MNVHVDHAHDLRSRGLNISAQRLAVLRAVKGEPHATADVIEGKVKTELGTVSKQAIYDALSALSEVGLLRRIQPSGSPARYESRVGDNHHHVICRNCGLVTDVDCAVGYTPCLTASNDAGYDIDEAEVIYWGRCRQCQTSTSPSSPAAEDLSADQ